MASLGYATPSLLAVATGIAGSAWASGTIASISLISVPAVLAVPQSSAQIWHGMFIGGASLMPKISTTVALSYAYAAYETRSRGGDWTGFLVAAGLLVSIVPFTLLVMSSTNTALINSAKGSSSLAQGQVSELIKKWAVLNLTRSLLPLAAAATGFVTFLKNVS